jgi:hypothetical protein
MKSKIAAFVVVVGVICALCLPDIVLTQGTIGRVLNRRTRMVFTGPGALSAAVAAAAPGDILLAAGIINEPLGVDLTGFAGTIVGETRLGFAPTIQVPGGVCPGTGAVISVTGAGGAVRLIGLNIIVPTTLGLCSGIFSVVNPNALTVSNCRITQTSTAFPILFGIDAAGPPFGPLVVQNNTITGSIFVGLEIISGAVATATVTGNRINMLAPGTGGGGIFAFGFPPGSTALIQRNVIDGGGAVPVNFFGIEAFGISGLTITRNTIRNFAIPGAFGLLLDSSPGAIITRNAIRDNFFGLLIDLATDSVTTPEIHDNNITSTVAGTIGLFFDSTSATYNLNASRNFWGAPSGPASVEEGANTCPEATGASCLTLQPAAVDGTGLGVANGAALADCGLLADQVNVCPHRTIGVIGAGA